MKVDMPSDPTENARASMALRDARASLKAAEKNLDYWESAVASAEQWVEETEGGDPR